MKDAILGMLDESYYLVAAFSGDELVLKNKRFDHYFHEITGYRDFKIRVVDRAFDDGVDSYFLRSPDGDGMIKFEKSSYMSNTLLIGVKLNYEKAASFIKHIERLAKVSDDKCTKFIDFNKNKLKSYCTFVVDDAWIVKYFSDNVYSILGIQKPHLKSIREIFGEEFADMLEDKMCYLDIFNDLALEYDDMLVVINKSEYGFIILNVYPYSGRVANKFDEIGALTYKVKQLEKELDRRKEVIDMQKEIIQGLTELSM